MRERFAAQLVSLTDELAEMCHEVERAVGAATAGVLARDPVALRSVIEACRDVDRRHRDIERRVVLILARQAPVGRDLRSIVSSLHIAADVGRMAGLVCHICEIGCRRATPDAHPLAAGDVVRAMGEQARELAASAAEVLADVDADGARRLRDADQGMDTLCRRLVDDIDAHADGEVAAGIDLALLARYYERFADHAVAVGRRVHFLSTGRISV